MFPIKGAKLKCFSSFLQESLKCDVKILASLQKMPYMKNNVSHKLFRPFSRFPESQTYFAGLDDIAAVVAEGLLTFLTCAGALMTFRIVLYKLC